MTSKPVTIKQIAEILKISVSSVSRALHDHPSIGLTTRAKVKKLAGELNYDPNQTAISFQKGKTYTIGVILPELSEAFFSAAISAIEDTAYKRNYTILLAQSHDEQEKEKQLIEKMKNHRVDGLLISVAKTTSSFEHFDMLKRYNIPIVFFDRIPPIKNIHYVACNMETGSIEAVNYLLQKGHRSIGMINGPSTLAASGERKEGYIKAMIKNRLKFDPSLVVSCDLTEQDTQAALDTLLANKRRPTAIVTFNDYIYLYSIKHARNLKINIESELQFVSYANLPIINYMDYAPVASVEQFPYLQGQKAADILIDLLNAKSGSPDEVQAYYKVIVESQLVESKKKVAK
ncbi:LacI family DNA-binding transcriptional regulator [Mucilaginibacter sp. SP1R1]|uniref:LacI family DNA-binding transcriptional regulator n=1 Tax=Mucilaginibacter sp. SP1R1 TaxID=2723091 RepID=UPI001615965F|nr:LacI family DNA-binding transcriptional regulator [Mucilaginibacter sp. SP1R1]MBB6149675.1 LacI family transcriptional regulator [Mucilaginibacter sp. SP1R1]